MRVCNRVEKMATWKVAANEQRLFTTMKCLARVLEFGFEF